MLFFIFILSIIGGIIGFGGGISYLYLINTVTFFPTQIVYERQFIRCFYLFLISFCVFIASSIAYFS